MDKNIYKIRQIDSGYWDNHNNICVFIHENDDPVKIKLPSWLKNFIKQALHEAYEDGYSKALQSVREKLRISENG